MTATPPIPTTMPRSPRPKPIASTAREKKHKKPQHALVRQSLHKNPTEIRQKGRTNNNKKTMEPLDVDEEELTMGVEDIDVEESMTITQLSAYAPPRKSTTNVTKDPKSIKY